jgi:hypothetical protein
MNGRDVLRTTAGLIERGWCQGADARDRLGATVPPTGQTAAAWSLSGALAHASERPDVELIAMRTALWGVSAVIPDWSLDDWNNAPGRTQAEVLQMLAAAAESLDRSPPPDPWPPARRAYR